MFDGEPHDACESRIGSVAVLIVDGVDRTPTAERLESCADHLGLGGVEHDRQRRRRRETASERSHVRSSVAADIVDVEVEHVRTVAGLVLGDVEALLVVLGEHRLAECLGAVGVGALADHQEAGVLVEGDRGVQRRRLRLVLRVPLRLGHVGDRGRDLTDVVGRRAATATDEGQAEFTDERRQRGRELVGLQRVHRAVGTELGKTGVGHDRDRDGGVPRQVAQMLTHLGGPGGAVESDHVDAERLDGGQRRPDLGTEQHGARGLDRHVRDDRNPTPELGHRPLGSKHGSLHLQQILGGLHKDRVVATVEHACDAFEVGVADGLERGVAEARQLCAGADGPEDVTSGAITRRPHLVGDTAGDGGALEGQFADAVGDVVVAEVREVAAECVRLHGIGAGLEVGAVDVGEYVGAGVIEDLVATLEVVEIVERQIRSLQHGAHRPIADQYSTRHVREERRVEVGGGTGGVGHGSQRSSLSLVIRS